VKRRKARNVEKDEDICKHSYIDKETVCSGEQRAMQGPLVLMKWQKGVRLALWVP
jgi:hypothetical protein